jgi:hypothetical protein
VQGLHEDETPSAPSAPQATAPQATAQPPAEITAGQQDQQSQIDALQQQIRDMQRASTMDAVPEASHSAKQSS